MNSQHLRRYGLELRVGWGRHREILLTFPTLHQWLGKVMPNLDFAFRQDVHAIVAARVRIAPLKMVGAIV